MAEEWRAVVGYEGRHEVSNYGRVRSLFEVNPRMLTLTLHGKYLYVVLKMKGRKDRCRQVGRIVAEAFIPNPRNCTEVNHISGIPSDNRVSNLEWVTRSENQWHASRTGLLRPSRGEDRTFAKLKEAQIPLIRARFASGESQRKIARSLHVAQTSISKIILGKTWKHVR